MISTDSDKMNWDGTEYPFASWNKDQDLVSAMQNSVNWNFQKMDAAIGLQTLRQSFQSLHYGNEYISGDTASYWLESSLKISPIEQVELLTRLYHGTLPFPADHMDFVKDSIYLEHFNGYNLYGKTGTGRIDEHDKNGWFIGYITSDNHAYIFAANIHGEDNASGKTAAEITLSVLNSILTLK